MSKPGLVILAASSFLYCSLALAQDTNRPYERGGSDRQWGDGGERHQDRCAEHYARRAGRLAYLEARLNLTEQQKAAWSKWRQIRLDTAEKRRSACLQHQPNRDEHPTALDREARVEKFLSDRLQTLQASRPALQALYDSLSPEQKVVFDQSVARRGHHRRGHGWHRQDQNPM